jgi:peptide-methionine (S)-S-oxide reductase
MPSTTSPHYSKSFRRYAFLTTSALSLVGLMATGYVPVHSSSFSPMTLPSPLLDTPLAKPSAQSSHQATKPALQKIILGGGCFWGIEAIFERTKGVTQAVSGYAGGQKNTAEYNLVSSGVTGHAEVVEVTYDPTQITLGQLLKIFFSVAHDPTQLNRQDPDVGTQYRSVIFYQSTEQQQIANRYIAQLNQAKLFKQPIVTQVVALPSTNTSTNGFYPAEEYHQDFVQKNPRQGYVVAYDLPKLTYFAQQFPEWVVSRK